MGRRLGGLMVAAAAALLTLAMTAPAEATPLRVPTARYIVTLDGAVGDVAATATHLVANLTGARVVRTYQYALKGFVVELPTVGIAARPVLRALPGVAAVERDATVTLAGTESSAPWGIDRVDQRDLPLNGTYNYNATGAGVTAYIIDTGVSAANTDFGGRVSPGTNTVDGDASTTDCNGHGTHVAGIVGGTTYGVAKGVNIVAVRVFGCSDSTATSAIIAGVDWVTGNHAAGAPAVANLSLGGAASDAMDASVRNMIADGVSTAVAAGNDTTAACSESPSRVNEALVVGATDANDKIASFSNFGPCVDLFAPGVNITSDGPASPTATQVFSGTSQATPHVTGDAALYLEQHPGSSPSAVQSGILANATSGHVTGIKTSCNALDNLLGSCMAGTPNLLLFTGNTPQGPPPPPPPACTGLNKLLGLC